jgi:hypothetical protein
MMKQIVTLFVALAATVQASMELEMPMEIKADSPLGMRLLSEATESRSLSDWTNTWISGYSLKFEGCHHISQWNPDAVRSSCDGEYATNL